MKEITSPTNPLIKQLSALISSKKARKQAGCFIIEGWRGIKTLLEHNSNTHAIKQIIISDTWEPQPLPPNIEVIKLPKSLFGKISDVRNAQGILAVIQNNQTENRAPTTGNYLLLDNLRDPGNLGTLIRSAVGANFQGILLYGDCVDPENPKVIRSTMGTFAHTNITSINLELIEESIEQGFNLCVTTGIGGENLYKTPFNDKNILVIGSEAHGVSEELFKLASTKITIPLEPQCESLNAAIAGSICMFHMQNSD